MTITIDKDSGPLARWVTFNSVGVVGIGVQLGALVALTEWLETTLSLQHRNRRRGRHRTQLCLARILDVARPFRP